VDPDPHQNVTGTPTLGRTHNDDLSCMPLGFSFVPDDGAESALARGVPDVKFHLLPVNQNNRRLVS
jgi:hypothetical protein